MTRPTPAALVQRLFGVCNDRHGIRKIHRRGHLCATAKGSRYLRGSTSSILDFGMILADTVKTLTSLTPTSLAQVVQHSGRKDAAFKTADFVGITNGGEFAYKITFFDRESTGKDQVSKVFVRYDTVTGFITADY